MSKENPILPSEPLSLQPDLIAAAVRAESAESQDEAYGRRLSPNSADRVRRRMDIRHYGRSESRGRTGERSASIKYRDRSLEHPAASSDYHLHDGSLPPHDRSAHEQRFGRRDRRSYSPGYGDSEYGARDDRDAKRYHSSGEGSADNMQSAYYTHDRSGDDGPKSTPTPSRILGIFGMSKFTAEHDLRDLFGEYGPVEKIQIIRDQHEGRSRGFAFVNMRNVEDAQKARSAITGTLVHNRQVRVDFSFTNRAHSPTPGKYKGQETGASSGAHGTHHHGERGGRHHSDGGRYGGGHRGGYSNGPRSNRSYAMAPSYHTRRRANTRDRRRREGYRHPPPRGGRQWGRSKSPGYHGNANAPRGSYDSYRGSTRYNDGARGGDYDDRRGSGHGNSGSPMRRYSYNQRNQRQPPPNNSYGSHDRLNAYSERHGRDDHRFDSSIGNGAGNDRQY
ncbi:hypothetical protein BX070DRAFT_228826 [Coemansia spiralis]|nr:hypothetical protein BX070DRAFT_228826 [Coemansia spiralis]